MQLNSVCAWLFYFHYRAFVSQPDLPETLRLKLTQQKDELQKQHDDWLRKGKELADSESKQPWNVDTIGHVTFNKSVRMIGQVSKLLF
jgi:hypothetical protein